MSGAAYLALASVPEALGRRLGCRRTRRSRHRGRTLSRACFRERINKERRQLLILQADNANAMRAATLESRLKGLGVLRSFSRPRVSNDNPYSESLFRTAKYRADYTSRPFTTVETAWQRGRRLWIGTTTGAATARSSSSRLSSATAVRPSRSIVTALSYTKKHASNIRVDSHDPCVAGVNQRCCA
jgi:transposase InsO family protein